ncbi:MAG: RNA polymerase sigma factor [Eubacterium sp.]|nr:RNA polymerase sigma factor [Eubacterium sp.]
MEVSQANKEIDESLFDKIAQGDDEAFTELYYATYKKIYGFLLSLTKNKEDAEDLLQNTYIKIRNGAHLYKKQGTPLTWMCTVAKNQFLDLARKNSKTQTVDITEMQNYISEGSGFSVSDKVETKMILSAAMKILNDIERSIFILHLGDGLKFREVAEVVGLPQNTVITKYNRCLKKMREYLER